MGLSKEIVAFLKNEFNLTVDDLNAMSDDELGVVYEKAADIEIEEAMKAGVNEKISSRGRTACDLMDALYNS